MKGKCHLCLEEKELQRKSHIIPEFIYSESNLFHKHHNLEAFDLFQFIKTGERKIIMKNQKTGFFDEYILCKHCDGVVLNKYETYGKLFFYSKKLPEGKALIVRNETKYIECLNADYTLLKLFFLSILWRADISRQQIFSEISLKDNVKEKLRNMLLNYIPLTDKEFPVFVYHTLFDKTFTKDHFLHPIKIKFGDEDGFVFIFGGFIITFTFGINGIPENLLKYRIQETGSFRALSVPPGHSWKLIRDWYKK
jgi:hypothetical protein